VNAVPLLPASSVYLKYAPFETHAFVVGPQEDSPIVA